MAKKEPEFLMADMGYGPAEHWERCEIIEEYETESLFDDEPGKNARVRRPGGEIVDVDMKFCYRCVPRKRSNQGKQNGYRNQMQR